jgi:hypothetical protein
MVEDRRGLQVMNVRDESIEGGLVWHRGIDRL